MLKNELENNYFCTEEKRLFLWCFFFQARHLPSWTRVKYFMRWPILFKLLVMDWIPRIILIMSFSSFFGKFRQCAGLFGMFWRCKIIFNISKNLTKNEEKICSWIPALQYSHLQKINKFETQVSDTHSVTNI